VLDADAAAQTQHEKRTGTWEFVLNGRRARRLARRPCDVIVSDMRSMPAWMAGHLLAKISYSIPKTVALVLSGQADPPPPGRLMRLGGMPTNICQASETKSVKAAIAQTSAEAPAEQRIDETCPIGRGVGTLPSCP